MGFMALYPAFVNGEDEKKMRKSTWMSRMIELNFFLTVALVVIKCCAVLPCVLCG